MKPTNDPKHQPSLDRPDVSDSVEVATVQKVTESDSIPTSMNSRLNRVVVSSSDEQIFTPTTSNFVNKDSPNTDFTSPSKSIKSFFRNRMSAHSIDSISEEPELRGRDDRRFSKLSKESSPTKSPIRSNFLLRPMFTRSKSSTTSIPQDTGPALNISTTKESKQVTIDDFADTSDEDNEEEQRQEAEADSINSLLEEYEARDSKYFKPSNPDEKFLFKEEFDESTSSEMLDASPPHTVLVKLNKIAHPESIETQLVKPPSISRSGSTKRAHLPIDTALANAEGVSSKRSSGTSSNDSVLGRRSGEISATSLKFRINQDRIEPVGRTNSKKLRDRAKVISASSNVDINRSAYNITGESLDYEPETKYPEPNVSETPTPLQTPRRQQIPSNPTSSNSGNTRFSIRSDPIDENASFVKRPRDSLVDISTTSHETALKHESLRLLEINYDETALKHQSTTSNNDTIRSSMSSGELLHKLENFYEKKDKAGPVNHAEGISKFNPQASSTLRFSQVEKKSAIGNLTAGIDATSELPVMLYTVQDRDYDEGNQRWSVYENRATGTTLDPGAVNHKNSSSEDSTDSMYHDAHPQPARSAVAAAAPSTSSSVPQPPKQVYIVESASHSQHSFSSVTSNTPLNPNTASTRVTSTNQDYIDRNFNEKIGDSRRDKPRSVQTKPSSGTLSLPHNAVVVDRLTNQPSDHHSGHGSIYSQDSFDMGAFEKQIGDISKERSSYRDNTQSYSVAKFIMLLVLGLIVPPIYFLLTLGVFDTANGASYSGLAYYKGEGKKFSKTQKIISLVIGLVWFSVVIAMIGVGIGLGIRENR